MSRPAQPLLRISPYLAIALLGFSIVVAGQSERTGTRGSRRARLIDLIAREDERARDLRHQLDGLQREIEVFRARAGTGERRLEQLRAQIESLGALVGLAPMAGPGVSVELRDSTLRRSPTGDLNDLVIHEQDLQAVVNALWAGGAEAMSINGERVVSTSAVRCVGNTLLLHGAVYAPPYRIAAIGRQESLLRALDRDRLVQRFHIFADEFRLGFDIRRRPNLSLPPFRGVIGAGRARIG